MAFFPGATFPPRLKMPRWALLLSVFAPPLVLASSPEEAEAVDLRYQRGWYMAEAIGDCQGCHTKRNPPDFSVPFGEEWAGGEEFGWDWKLPGSFVTPNLTPDVETGLGTWTTDDIKNAIRNGFDKDGQRLFPLMPSHYYQSMSDDDLDDLVYYLQKLPARKKPMEQETELSIAREDIPPLPLVTHVPTPAADPVSRGRYIVVTANCLTCHTTTEKGRHIESRYMAGGVLITAPWATVVPPNITPAEKTGVAGYTEEEFFRLMRTGIKRNGARLLFNYMPWYVYKNMTDADIQAVYAYMMSVPPIENDVNDPKNQFPLGN